MMFKNLVLLSFIVILSLSACSKEDLPLCEKCGTYTGTFSVETTLPVSTPLIYDVLGEIIVTKSIDDNYMLSFDFMPLLGDTMEIWLIDIAGNVQADSLLLSPTSYMHSSGGMIDLEGSAVFSNNNEKISCRFDFSNDLVGNIEFEGSK